MSGTQIYSNENNVTVTSGNTLQILAGTVSGLTVNNGGKVYNYSTVNNAVLQSGANFENDYKTTSGLTAQSGSELTFLGGGMATTLPCRMGHMALRSIKQSLAA
ncbi:hypothetical protein AD933_03785 [Acetobacter malorum]|uniref:Uncharacterized protein n=1 Tax=Acetobacter malorum TaxID=178901 RepID=A0A149RTY1_9PROT|nr:hypothetical protein [Acetobacter malorum]KXV17895.1 hypothetical protein AD933_03785 [Acetobacter malorum]